MAWEYPWSTPPFVEEADPDAEGAGGLGGGIGGWVSLLPAILGAAASIRNPGAGAAIMGIGDYFRRQRMADLAADRDRRAAEAQRRRQQMIDTQNRTGVAALQQLDPDIQIPTDVPYTVAKDLFEAQQVQRTRQQQQTQRDIAERRRVREEEATGAATEFQLGMRQRAPEEAALDWSAIVPGLETKQRELYAPVTKSLGEAVGRSAQARETVQPGVIAPEVLDALAKGYGWGDIQSLPEALERRGFSTELAGQQGAEYETKKAETGQKRAEALLNTAKAQVNAGIMSGQIKPDTMLNAYQRIVMKLTGELGATPNDTELMSRHLYGVPAGDAVMIPGAPDAILRGLANRRVTEASRISWGAKPTEYERREARLDAILRGKGFQPGTQEYNEAMTSGMERIVVPPGGKVIGLGEVIGSQGGPTTRTPVPYSGLPVGGGGGGGTGSISVSRGVTERPGLSAPRAPLAPPAAPSILPPSAPPGGLQPSGGAPAGPAPAQPPGQAPKAQALPPQSTGPRVPQPMVSGETPPVGQETALAVASVRLARVAGQRILDLVSDPKSAKIIEKHLGPYAQYWEPAMRWAPYALLGEVPKEVIDLRQNHRVLTNYFIKLVSGAQVSEGEAWRLIAMFPQLSSRMVPDKTGYSPFKNEVENTMKNIRELEGMVVSLALRGNQQAAVVALDAGLLKPGDVPQVLTPRTVPLGYRVEMNKEGTPVVIKDEATSAPPGTPSVEPTGRPDKKTPRDAGLDMLLGR